MDYRLPIPQNWQDFESLCHRLWIEIWNDPSAKKHGRVGQEQFGVDIYGVPVFTNLYSGVQCKDKNGQLGSALKANELIRECEKAMKFTPSLNAFTMATTAPRDAAIQAEARYLTGHGRYPFTVDVWFWDDLQSEIIYRPNILDGYYKGVSFIEEGQTQINLQRHSGREKCSAFFSRPLVQESLVGQLKTYLITLAYELSDNSFQHGKATEFNIALEGNKIRFTDNGKYFNLLEELDPSKVSSTGHIGSFILFDFLKKFEGHVYPQYRREIINCNERNVLEFEFAVGADDLIKQDYIEIQVDWRMAAGRSSADRLATSMPITEGIKDVIWNITDGYALSFSTEFIRVLLQRLKKDQKLILYVPRDRMYENLESWFNDQRLSVYIR